MHSIESRFAIGPENILFSDVYVCNFQPGNLTGRGSEGANGHPSGVTACTPSTASVSAVV